MSILPWTPPHRSIVSQWNGSLGFRLIRVTKVMITLDPLIGDLLPLDYPEGETFVIPVLAQKSGGQ